jgi:hypothetical protein
MLSDCMWHMVYENSKISPLIQLQISCFTINPYIVVHDKFQCPRKGVFNTQLVTLTLVNKPNIPWTIRDT